MSLMVVDRCVSIVCNLRSAFGAGLYMVIIIVISIIIELNHDNNKSMMQKLINLFLKIFIARAYFKLETIEFKIRPSHTCAVCLAVVKKKERSSAQPNDDDIKYHFVNTRYQSLLLSRL